MRCSNVRTGQVRTVSVAAATISSGVLGVAQADWEPICKPATNSDLQESAESVAVAE